jgi:site-specific recombinase XerD
MLRETPNLKHRAILATIYGLGLRKSELSGLLLGDVETERGQVRIQMAKGNKDRVLRLPPSPAKLRVSYRAAYQPQYWLFEGQSGEKYSNSSVQAILRRAVRVSGVNPFCTVHTLRHSYAIHLLEVGTSLRHIQVLLGHASSPTTEIYTHVSTSEKQRVISPLDRI